MFCSTGRNLRIALMTIVALVGAHSLTAAQQPDSAASAPPLSAEQLDQLIAPIALYPDPLIAQILMAATYPLEVVEADRWLRISANAALRADALTAALQRQPWDPSVKSIVLFREVLHMMDTNLDWTERLGDAFLAQQADVMDAVQRLRHRAQAAGALASTPQQTVSTDDQEIMIEPANPEIVYLPIYNPWCAYDGWPYPDYPPFYFGSWVGHCVPLDSGIAFDGGIYPSLGFWAWGHFDWRRHDIRVDRERFQQFHTGHEAPGGIWQHDPAHRRGVPYRDPRTATRFLDPTGAAPRTSRGFAPAPAIMRPAEPVAPSIERAPAAIRPPADLAMPERPTPPAFESFGPGAQVRGEAARGFSSRMSPAIGAPSFHAAPMPSFHGGGGPSFHGGGGFGGRR
jgi:hypothetical protein